MPREVTAHVAYDGQSVADGSMDVRELAPALLALGDLLQSANETLNGDRAALMVRVESDFRQSSFEIHFGLSMVPLAHVMSILGRDTLKSAKEIADYVGLVSGTRPSLFGFLKWLRGRPPSAITSLSTGDGNVVVRIEGENNQVTVRQEVYQLAQEPKVRKAVADTLKPLQDPGIQQFEVRDGGNAIETVQKEDLPFFSIPPASGALSASTSSVGDRFVEVIKPSFQPDLKWVFSDGSGGRMNASMKDSAFLQRVESGQRTFGKGDVLRVAIKSTPQITRDGLRTDHEVLRVLDELNAPRQHGLLPEPNTGEDE